MTTVIPGRVYKQVEGEWVLQTDLHLEKVVTEYGVQYAVRPPFLLESGVLYGFMVKEPTP